MSTKRIADGSETRPNWQSRLIASERDLIRFGNDQLTMSSREIAELCGKEHRNVLRDIRGYVERGVLKTEQTPYIDAQNGQTYYEFSLNKRDTLLVVSAPMFSRAISDMD